MWAYNSSNLSEEELTVPTCRWTFPNGEVDPSLNIATSEVTNEHEDTEFELRWEFDAGVDGEKADWQPMSKDMNDALEKRWTEGWHGEDGTDIFYVHSGYITYGINCNNMVQWNKKTRRTREIRRGEVRPDVTLLLPKLAEKDAEVERLRAEKSNWAEEKKELQNERDGLVEDRNSLVQERKKLMENISKLECLGAENPWIFCMCCFCMCFFETLLLAAEIL